MAKRRCGPDHPCGGGMQKGLNNPFFGNSSGGSGSFDDGLWHDVSYFAADDGLWHDTAYFSGDDGLWHDAAYF